MLDEQRNTIHEPSTPVTQLGVEGVVNVLDRGTFDRWVAVAEAVRANPWGPTADAVDQALDQVTLSGMANLFETILREARGLPAVALPHREVEMWP